MADKHRYRQGGAKLNFHTRKGMATAHFINNLDKGPPEEYIINNIRHLR